MHFFLLDVIIMYIATFVYSVCVCVCVFTRGFRIIINSVKSLCVKILRIYRIYYRKCINIFIPKLTKVLYRID